MSKVSTVLRDIAAQGLDLKNAYVRIATNGRLAGAAGPAPVVEPIADDPLVVEQVTARNVTDDHRKVDVTKNDDEVTVPDGKNARTNSKKGFAAR